MTSGETSLNDAATPAGRHGSQRRAPAEAPPQSRGLAAFLATTVTGCQPVQVEASFELEDSGQVRVPVVTGEYWSAAQRQGCSLHEVSYRACFKPALPAFFIERFTNGGDVVHDPFAGRGTTLLEAALRGRVASGNDANPLSRVLVLPRLAPPRLADIASRLLELEQQLPSANPRDLAAAHELGLDAFFHDHVLRTLCALRRQFMEAPELDPVDAWIRMVAVGRLTGHSNGFFSVYSLPPNQAVTAAAQRKINAKRDQVPPDRDVFALILRKSKSLLRRVGEGEREALAGVQPQCQLHTGQAGETTAIASGSVQLVVTSPPFLDVVQYAADNWLRCWFCGIDPDGVSLTITSKTDAWAAAMEEVLREQDRILRPGGHVAFEVGEVRGGKLALETLVVPAAVRAGLTPVAVVLHTQDFTKTANCWGVANNRKGTNTQRIVVLRKDEPRQEASGASSP